MSLARTYRGAFPYKTEQVQGAHRVHVAVACYVEGGLVSVDAMLHTGAEWSVVPGGVSALLEETASAGEEMRLDSRLGSFEGRLVRANLVFPAVEGETLEIEATCLLCPEWPGAMVLGWKGCLERFSFALDQQNELFCFAEL